MEKAPMSMYSLLKPTKATVKVYENTHTHRVGDVWLRPCDLEGLPFLDERVRSADGKVSRMYVLKRDSKGGFINHMFMYDYKATSAYDETYPAYDDFWASKTYFNFSLAATAGVAYSSTEIWLALDTIYTLANRRINGLSALVLNND